MMDRFCSTLLIYIIVIYNFGLIIYNKLVNLLLSLALSPLSSGKTR